MLDLASNNAPARYRGFGGKFKATGTWFVPDETWFIEKKVIAGRIDLIGINRIEPDELTDFIESAAQVDSSDALDGGFNQEGFHTIRVSVKGFRQLPRTVFVS